MRCCFTFLLLFPPAPPAPSPPPPASLSLPTPAYLSSPPYKMVWPPPLPQLPGLGLSSQMPRPTSSLPRHPWPPGTPGGDWLPVGSPEGAILPLPFQTCGPLGRATDLGNSQADLLASGPTWSSQVLQLCLVVASSWEVTPHRLLATCKPLCPPTHFRAFWPLGREPRQDGWHSLEPVASCTAGQVYSWASVMGEEGESAGLSLSHRGLRPLWPSLNARWTWLTVETAGPAL